MAEKGLGTITVAGGAVTRQGDTPVVVIGAGGHGRVILDILRCAGRTVCGLLDDNPDLHGQRVNGVDVLGGIEEAPRLASEGACFVVGIGDNLARGRVIRRFLAWGASLTTAVHPSAVIAADVAVEPGVVVMAGAVVNTGSRLGVGSCVNTRAVLDHDNILGELAHVFPGAVLTGGVQVGRYAVIGSGAVVLPYQRVGENAYVGAGAVVGHEVPPNTVVVGVPAKFLKHRDPLPDI